LRTLKSSIENGRLSEVIESIRQDRRIKEMESVGQDSRVSQAMQSAQEVTFMCKQVSSTLQSLAAEDRAVSVAALLQNGRLAKFVAQVKREEKAKEEESLRQDMRKTFQSSLLDDRLMSVLSSVVGKSRARQASSESMQDFAMEGIGSQQVASTPRPAKPICAKTSSRPIRRFGAVAVVAGPPEFRRALGAAAEVTLSSQALAQPPGQSARPPTPPSSFATPRLDLLEAGDAEGGSLFGARRVPSSIANLSSLSRPASPVGALPPVVAPVKKTQLGPTSRPCSRSSPSAQSAMCLDIALSPAPSAMMLDLGLGVANPSVIAPRPVSTSRTSAKYFDFGTSAKMFDIAGKSDSALGWTLGVPASSKTSSLLPPIPGVSVSKSLLTEHYLQGRSRSTDSFVWGVAPTKQAIWS